MIKFTSVSLGNCVLKFHHNKPYITVPQEGNCLADMVNTIKFVQGSTDCILQIDVEDGYPSYEFFGKAFLYPTDRYNKETGRLNSLTRAVEAATKDGDLSAAEGREVMAAYYNR